MKKTFVGSSLAVLLAAGIIGGLSMSSVNAATPTKQQLLQNQQNLIAQKNSVPASQALANGNVPVSVPVTTEPDAYKVVQQLQVIAVPFWKGANVKSVWRDGSQHNKDYTVWDPYIVWSGAPNGTPTIGTYVMGATGTDFNQYTQSYACPQNVGNITITGITGSVVSFTTDSGSTGTLDLSNGQWNI